ncbi:MAG: thiamine pyrophosphate-dependent dehydrogenase E1 component subunit alpha [Verrucomicrobiae bacterium]
MTEVNPLILLREMLRIRKIEEALANRYSEQEMRCPMHLCIGQEAVAVGVCKALSKDDVMFSNHRAHGHYLAKGGNLNAMIAELYGRSTGCCGGRGGSMHLIDMGVGFLGSTPIVGGTVPLAVGAAWASSLNEENRVSVIFLGDGCFEEGVVHESLNFAALHKLPVVFVCENNRFSVYTRVDERQPDRLIYKVAAAHGVSSYTGDGNNVEEVLALSRMAVGLARRGEGPQFLEFHVYRWREHCGPDFDDHLNYRTTQEISRGIQDCPIARYIHVLDQKAGLNRLALEKIELEIQDEITAAFHFALTSEKPNMMDAQRKVYA